MLYTLHVRPRPALDDCVGRNVAVKIRAALGIAVDDVRQSKTFIIEGISEAELHRAFAGAALHDPVLQEASLAPFPAEEGTAWMLEVGFRPGVTDNEARTARDTLALVLGRPRDFAVYTVTQYALKGAVLREEAESIARDLLANDLIQRYSIKSGAEWQREPGFAPVPAKVTGAASDQVDAIPVSTMTDDDLLRYSRENTLALSLEEMHAIKAHYALPAVREARKAYGLGPEPTDAELEVLAQTWSEHCKHKIFSACVDYENTETGRRETINSLYKTCIQASTATLRKRMGENDFCRSVFKDNAGVVAFCDTHDVCIKVETHNSPSALDPYGGALTGIVGVNRDPMGTGLGANLVCNTDVFCFASPFYEGELPPRLLHPRRVMEGVREGVEHGGNKSGVPTVNGSVVFDERYLGKPLVYCGTVGLIPRLVAGRPGHAKKALVGDAVVMAGGRIGKDGIHGATFSSEELHEGSPATAVQIGDPITQRKLYDFMLRARDLGLYNAITDNGAGGLSSSVGEMAEDTGGCRMDLSRAPLKYDGLRPWEILLSEAQERMTFAVPQNHLQEFMALAKSMDVEAANLGEYTDSGFFHVLYAGRPVACLPMSFMHDGNPQMRLAARWERPAAYAHGPLRNGGLRHKDGSAAKLGEIIGNSASQQAGLLKKMLSRLNICSKEYLIRQYDHEVKGGSVIKPLVGVKRDGPADAGVMRPLLHEPGGIVLSHGICPKFSDADTYWMMANAIDEAVRNAVSVGADPALLAGVDNFCWCDPVQSEKTPDGEYKMAQLVRANKALEQFCLSYGLPCVSGKDSMKNDYTGGGEKISIPPTVLFSVLGRVHDAAKAVTSDFKAEGHALYLLGLTRSELAGSELASELGLHGGAVPEVDALAAKGRYHTLYAAIGQGLVSACHDLSDGGLAVAVAEMCIGGRLGATLNLDSAPVCDDLSAEELLYSESASRLLVTVAPENKEAFESLFDADTACARIGTVEGDALVIHWQGKPLLSVPADDLAVAFRQTFDW